MRLLSSVRSGLTRKRVVGLVFLSVIFTLFLLFNRIPKLDTVREDLDAASAPNAECFQGFCLEHDPDIPLLSRWWDFSITYLEIVTIGMIFAFLIAGLTEVYLFPQAGKGFADRGIKGSLKGLLVGPAMNLCSACIIPVANAFRSRGAGIEATISITQGSSTLNFPAMIMALIVFTPTIAGTRIGLSIIGALFIGPLAAMAVGQRRQDAESSLMSIEPQLDDTDTWKWALTTGILKWLRASVGYLIRLGPVMVLAGFISGLVIQWISPDVVSTWLGESWHGVLVAATLGLLINVPLLFEIPLVVALMLVGMGTAPAATLLFAAAAGGPITFWGLARAIPLRGIVAYGTAIWMLGVVGGLAVWLLDSVIEDSDMGIRSGVVSARVAVSPDSVESSHQILPFTNVASTALDGGIQIWNYRPGVAVFDYDRDGDMDFYITAEAESANFLYRNDGDGNFTNVSEAAGVSAVQSNSSGVVACDFDNDGYQDLYVGGKGLERDGLDYRSAMGDDESATRLREAIIDRLYRNNGDGTFSDVTHAAFGDAINLRSATTIACADVDGDGWLDIYVGNLIDEDFFFTSVGSSHPGHFNTLYMNKGDMIFEEISEIVGVRGPQITMRYPDGSPVMFEDSVTGQQYEGYDPQFTDKLGNVVGDPTGPTHAVMLLDFDEDNDPDLWVATDGDRLQLYRNDSVPGAVKFTPVAEEMGFAIVGNWMGFASGDYDGDGDLDVFVTNVGYHMRLDPPQETPSSNCKYHDRFEWGTCLHFMLTNDGQGGMEDKASSIPVTPSPFMPPASLDPANIDPAWDVPTGLAAYDFGYGATFFDFDNDGNQDLYWLGSEIASYDGPGGNVYPAAGRMLKGDGQGSFEDITVRARLLDVLGVRYSELDSADPDQNLRGLKISADFHENGKGLAHGDLNGDGYVDLIGTNSAGPIWTGSASETERAPGPVFVWMNGGGANHWLNVRLRGRMAVDGTGSNADGIGARVYVTTSSDTDEPLIQVQEVRAGSSYLSMDSVNLEFGVGKSTTVDEIVTQWPSGRRQSIRDVPVDQTLVITEPRRLK